MLAQGVRQNKQNTGFLRGSYHSLQSLCVCVHVSVCVCVWGGGGGGGG